MITTLITAGQQNMITTLTPASQQNMITTLTLAGQQNISLHLHLLVNKTWSLHLHLLVNLLCPADLAGKVGIDGDDQVNEDLLGPGLLKARTQPLAITVITDLQEIYGDITAFWAMSLLTSKPFFKVFVVILVY